MGTGKVSFIGVGVGKTSWGQRKRRGFGIAPYLGGMLGTGKESMHESMGTGKESMWVWECVGGTRKS